MEESQAKKSQPSAKPESKESATDVLHFEKWISSLGERKATDLHLLVGNVPSIRIDAKIQPLMDEEIITAERLERIVEHLLSEDELKSFQEKKQLVISRTLKKSMRFRIHFYFSRGYAGLSLRHLQDAFIPISELPNSMLLKETAGSKQGLYVVSGPFDSGKTSTVRSLISEINQTQAKYIITLESPIEYIIASDKSVVVQREIGKDIQSFEKGLTGLHDEDLDVLVVGELEEPGVLEQILEIASSGRLVIAITSGNHIVSVLEHLRDLAAEEDRARILHLLADVLIGISAQVLLPKVGGGRYLVVSNMIATNPIKSLIHEGKFDQIPNIMQTSGESGMMTMDKALTEAVRQGIVIMQDAKEHAIDINQFNVLVAH
tara:strand:+ start:402 stop:1529 length:1128 start_codon:yes stop_codon:yes gene_type:complete